MNHLAISGQEFLQILTKDSAFSRISPSMFRFFRNYLTKEKAVSFRGKYVLNMSFPPYPSQAFRRFLEGLSSPLEDRLYSVTLAVTNRCHLRCWHCYNAGRSLKDMPKGVLERLAEEIKNLGAVIVTLTGGEPLLRKDLVEITRFFGEECLLCLGTTGEFFTKSLAKALLENGLFAIGVSVDSESEERHDQLRGKKGCFKAALKALEIAREVGLYPYLVTVATHEFLDGRDSILPFLEFAKKVGALEVHLLEPSPVGRLAGRRDVLLSQEEKAKLLFFQEEASKALDLPILSCFDYVESKEAFGCGAGLTHIYIDGSGEVSPCNLVPLTFGNVCRASLASILSQMRQVFKKPRTKCLACELSCHIPKEGVFPAKKIKELSLKVSEGDLPRFFQIQRQKEESLGRKEIQIAYDKVYEDYEEHWLKRAGRPIEELVRSLPLRGDECAFEAGTGTGYATLLLAKRLSKGRIIGVDLSSKMLEMAKKRLEAENNVELVQADALEWLFKKKKTFHLVFSSWVLGYIPLTPFFQASWEALRPKGLLAFLVHQDNSPREPLEIFREMVTEYPEALLKKVEFDFPASQDELREKLSSNGFEVLHLEPGKVVFSFSSKQEALDHLLRSGAGTVYYEAIHPELREELTKEYCRRLGKLMKQGEIQISHAYYSCIAQKLR